MNKKFLHYLSSVIIAIVCGSVLLLQNSLAKNLYELMSGEVKRQLSTNASLMTNDIRNDLLVNDIRSARVKLGMHMKQKILLGYRITKSTEIVDEVSLSENGSSMVISEDIFFSEGGTAWGRIDYYYSTEMFSNGFNKAKETLWINLVLVGASIFLIVFSGLATVYASSVKIYPILDSFVVNIGRIHAGAFVKFAWSPLINALNGSVEKYERLRVENEQNRESAAIGKITMQLSHDLRSPLSSIERLLHLPPDTRVLSQRKMITESLHRIHAMIESLRHGKADLLVNLTVFNPDFTPSSYGLDSKANERGILMEEVPLVLFAIRADKLKFERAWVNLASNAIDFARTRVRITIEPRGQDMILRVIDDGAGVPDEFLPKLFQRGATHGKHDGTGLGLAYVRQIMRGHGGDVRYYRENDMTVFECFLPNVVVTMDDVKEPMPQEGSEVPQQYTDVPPDTQQVSICFSSEILNQRVQERLAKLDITSHSFTIGFHKNSSIVLTNFEEVAEEAIAAQKRIIMFDESLSDDEIVRRAPIRLGLKG